MTDISIRNYHQQILEYIKKNVILYYQTMIQRH